MAVAAARKRTTATATTTGTPTYVGSRSGLTYKLGQQIGAGGNGTVYAVSRHPELVAKIQHNKPTAHEVEKLEALVRGASPELMTVAAWPMDLLKAGNGEIVGYVMPRVLEARPLHELYSPRARVQHVLAVAGRHELSLQPARPCPTLPLGGLPLPCARRRQRGAPVRCCAQGRLHLRRRQPLQHPRAPVRHRGRGRLRQLPSG